MNVKALASRVARLALLPIVALSLAACGDAAVVSPPQATVSATTTSITQGGTTEATVAPASGTATTPVEQPGGTGSTGSLDLMKVGDPCALLTKQEVESILGPVDYKADDSVRTPMRLACNHVLPTGSTGGTHLSIAVESTMNWVGVTSLNEGGEHVGGIGNDAYTFDENNERPLWVLVQGKVIVNVVLYPTDLEKSKQLAGKIIEKLP